MKILVPIDGSTYSENSLAFVASRTSLLGHSPEIELLVVLDPLPARAARLVGKDSLMRYYEEEAEKIFAPARKFLVGHNIHVNEAFIVGDPAEKISEEATRLNVDLIIMGSRGRTALAGLFLGSVTNGVLARTKNPILIVRNKNAPDRDGMRVGVCVDGSKYGSAAVKYAIRNGDLFGDGMRDFWKSGPQESVHINRWLAQNCFGDYYTRKGLDDRQRELITFCFLAAQGGCEPQLTSHAGANMRIGNDKIFLIAVLSRCLPYIGYPRSLNALRCINDAANAG